MNINCGNVMNRREERCRCNRDVDRDRDKKCMCECRFVPRTESVIAVRGPGCINSGGCENVAEDRGSRRGCSGQVSPCGNIQSNHNRRDWDCNCSNRRRLRDLLDNFFDDASCPR